MNFLLELAAELKAKKKQGVPHRLCEGKNIALLVEKTSTRTRCAFEVAAAELGMAAVYLDPSGSKIGKKESVADTAQVLGRMFDGIDTVALVRNAWRGWRSMQTCRSGMN